MTITLKTAGVAKGVVESAVIPDSAGIEEYKPWDMDIHNIGNTGVFGGGICNAYGPGSVVVKWQGEETELSPDPSRALIFYYTDAKPNCTHLKTSGEIKFMAEGTYTIRVYGVHRENSSWIADDYKEFTVEVSGAPPSEEKCSLSGVVTGLLGIPVGGATVELNGKTRTTNSAGEYVFVNVALGSYTLKVTKEPWYETYTKDLNLTIAGHEYTENVGLGLKSYILYGVPLAAVAGIGGVIYVKSARAPEYYKAPPGYELVPRAPPGYRLVRK